MMLEILQELGDAGSRRGLYLHPDFTSSPTFLPYSEFPARVAAAAEHLRAQGIKPGDRVILPFETRADVIFSFFGLMEVGAVPLSVKPYILSTPRQSYCEFLTRISERYGAHQVLDTPSLSGLGLPMRLVSLPMAQASGVGVKLRKVAPEELAFVQLSSGSTSFPKGVPISHRNLVLNLQAITGQGGFVPDDVGCSWLPLYHDMGLVGGLLACVYGGCDIHIFEPASFLMDPVGWLEFLASHRCTLGVIPNFAIDYSLKFLNELDIEEDLGQMDLSALRSVYLGSEPINIPNLERFTALLAPRGLRREAIRPCYGMAEAVLMVSCVGLDGWRTLTSPSGQPAISVGKPVARFDVRLRAEDGGLCGERTLGEIELRGGSLAAAYYEDQRTLQGEDGFYTTGDVGFLHDGELFITGRISDRIKINGGSYFSSDFEQAIERLPFIRTGRTAVIQVDSRVVVLAEVQHPSAVRQREDHQRKVCEAILKSVGVTIAEQDVLFIRYGQLLKTSSGKLQRRALSGAYREGRIRVATPLDVRMDLLRLRAQRLFYGSWFEARKRGQRLLSSGRAAIGQGLKRLRPGSARYSA